MKLSQLFDVPSKWTKGCDARNNVGEEVEVKSKTAICWCLSGGLGLVPSTETRYTYSQCLDEAVIELFPTRYGLDVGFANKFVDFNDHPDTTFEDVQKVILRAEELGKI